MAPRGVTVLVLMIACGGPSPTVVPTPSPSAPATPYVDENVEPLQPLGGDEPLLTPMPDTFRYFPGGCVLRGVELRIPDATVMNDCVVCECGVFGGRCSRRVDCPADVCVLADGQVLEPGESGLVDVCTRCTCGADGLASCERLTDGDCPAEGCAYVDASGFDQVAPFGELLISETAWCFCDAELGFEECGGFIDYCELPSGANFDHGERFAHPDGCGTCLCLSGLWEDYCDLRGCD